MGLRTTWDKLMGTCLGMCRLGYIRWLMDKWTCNKGRTTGGNKMLTHPDSGKRKDQPERTSWNKFESVLWLGKEPRMSQGQLSTSGEES